MRGLKASHVAWTYLLLFLLFYSSVFGHQNPGFGLDQDPYPDPDSLEMLDPDLDSINQDPQLIRRTWT